jgi:hypothetical protein
MGVEQRLLYHRYLHATVLFYHHLLDECALVSDAEDSDRLSECFLKVCEHTTREKSAGQISYLAPLHVTCSSVSSHESLSSSSISLSSTTGQNSASITSWVSGTAFGTSSAVDEARGSSRPELWIPMDSLQRSEVKRRTPARRLTGRYPGVEYSVPPTRLQPILRGFASLAIYDWRNELN